MSALPVLAYDQALAENHAHYHDDFGAEPTAAVFVDPAQVKDKIMEYFGAILARCWFDRDLLDSLERDAHRTLRYVGIHLPDELEVNIERSDRQRPRLIIHEWNAERTFKRRICYLQMIMLAGR